MKITDFINVAKEYANLSKDPNKKVAALIFGPGMEVRAQGWNGFPRKIQDDSYRYSDKETKLKFIVHAEANAIANAARSGVSTEGCSMLVVGSYPCNDCAKLIIQSGIKEIYVPYPDENSSWSELFTVAKLLFKEAGIEEHWFT